MISNCPAWLPKSIIYQIFTGRWQAEIDGNQILKLDNFQKLSTRNWQKLIDLGINCFYFLGIFDNRGPILVNNENGQNLSPEEYPRVPSLFALNNHQFINPVFGNESDFRHLVKTIQNLGAKVIVDFVPNHTAINHPWVSDHPEFYIRENDNFIAEFSGDVYKLNYNNPQLCREMISVLDYIYNLGVDGVRCDMAHLVPDFFWQEAISTIKNKNHNFAFMAEAYPNSIFDYSNIHTLYNAGFDAIYNNALFENLKKVLVDTNPVDYLISAINYQKQNQPKLAINYFFNHDDPPLDNKQAQSDLNHLSQDYLEALFALILFLPEMAFIYNGSLLGRIHRLAHHWLEPLEHQYLETEHPLPDNLKKLFDLRKQIKDFSLKKVWQENGLLCLVIDKFTLILNLSKSNQNFNNDLIPVGQTKILES